MTGISFEGRGAAHEVTAVEDWDQLAVVSELT